MEWTAKDLEASTATTLGEKSAPRSDHMEPTLTASHHHVVQATPPLPTESGWDGLETAMLRAGVFEDVLITGEESGDSMAVSLTFPGIATVATSPPSTAVISAPHTLPPSGSSGPRTSASLDTKTCQDSPLPTLSLSSPDVAPSSTCLPPLASLGPPDSGHHDHAVDHIYFTTMFIVLPVGIFVIFIVFLLVIIIYFRRKKKKKKFAPGVVPMDLYVNAKNDVTLDPLPLLAADAEVEALQPGETLFRVVHPFTARQAGQLSLELGSTVVVFEAADKGWWRGREVATDRMGWFPGAYVQELQNDITEAVTEKEAASTKLQPRNRVSSFQLKKRGCRQSRASSEENGDLSPTPQETAATLETPATPSDDQCPDKGRWFRARYDYQAARQGELTVTRGERVQCLQREAGWVLGLASSGSRGWLPAVYVSAERPEEQSGERARNACYQQLEVNKQRQADQEWLGIVHRATYSYHSACPEDLAFSPGDRVVVFQTLDNGWWLGFSGGRAGWFPGSYVQVVEETGNRQSVASLGSLSTGGKTDNSSRASLEGVETSLSAGAVLDLTSVRPASPAPSLETATSLNPDLSPSHTQTRQRRKEGRPARPAPPPPRPRGKTSVSGNALPLAGKGPGQSPASGTNEKHVGGAGAGTESVGATGWVGGPEADPRPPSGAARVRLVHMARDVVELGRLGTASSRQPPPRPPNLSLSSPPASRGASPTPSPRLPRPAPASLGSGGSIGNLSETSELGSPGQGGINAKARESPVWVKRDGDTEARSPSGGAGRAARDGQQRIMGVRPWTSTARPREPLRVLPPCLPPSLPPSEKVEVGVPHMTQEPNKMVDPAVTSAHNRVNEMETIDQTNRQSDDRVSSSEERSRLSPDVSAGDHDVPAPGEASAPDIQVKTQEISLLAERRRVAPPPPSEKVDVPRHSAAAEEDKGREGETGTLNESEGAEDVNAVPQTPSPSAIQQSQRQSAPPFARPPPPKSPPPKAHCVVYPSNCRHGSLSTKRKLLRRAVRSCISHSNGELSFEEGTYIKDIRQSVERPGWNVGMLADGTTGLYRNDCVEDVADTAVHSVPPDRC